MIQTESETQKIQKFILQKSGIDFEKYQSGKLSAEEWRKIFDIIFVVAQHAIEGKYNWDGDNAE